MNHQLQFDMRNQRNPLILLHNNHPQILIDAYEKHGYSVSTYTDFNQAGIRSEGEKVMFVITKER
ncbi:hypothetical protein PT115_09340, partial [Erysipelothrix rhusiopathiae]|nr:hypothetical protein [Erysipelothrix rhusiopathiae]